MSTGLHCKSSTVFSSLVREKSVAYVTHWVAGEGAIGRRVTLPAKFGSVQAHTFRAVPSRQHNSHHNMDRNIHQHIDRDKIDCLFGDRNDHVVCNELTRYCDSIIAATRIQDDANLASRLLHDLVLQSQLPNLLSVLARCQPSSTSPCQYIQRAPDFAPPGSSRYQFDSLVYRKGETPTSQ